MLHYARLGPDEDTAPFANFVFPGHREYLNHLGPDGSDLRPGAPRRAVAVAADILGQPVGLAIAAQSQDSCRAELLSVVVAPSTRRAGIADGLLSNLERELRELGVSELWTRVTEGDQSIPVARLLDRQGYQRVDRGSFVWYAARPCRLLDSPGLAAASHNLELVPCTLDLIEALRPFGDAEGCAPTCLAAEEYHPAWSFLARRQGFVAGWILGTADREMGRASALYTVPGHRSLDLTASLIRTFVRNLMDADVGRVTWEVALANRAWCRLMDRLLARYADERLVTHTLRKTLQLREQQTN